MKKVSIRPNSDSGIGQEGFDLDGFVNIDNVLALMTELEIKKGNTLTRTRVLPMTLTTSPT